ncbi:MAG: gluconokinase [Methylacidiphilales bacterium]|nr:gluconokinase [Candidatus Methylacidiphilales bacterium]
MNGVFIVMGVSGSGKTTVAHMLARATGGDWLDADDFHPAENKAKMSAGVPLTDDDRWPWLDLLNAKLRSAAGETRPVFLACSALKQKYRDRLVAGLPRARFVYLKGSFELIHSRLVHRSHHFMPASLLESQFADLEEPKDAIVLDISRTDDQLLEDFQRLARAGEA